MKSKVYDANDFWDYFSGTDAIYLGDPTTCPKLELFYIRTPPEGARIMVE